MDRRSAVGLFMEQCELFSGVGVPAEFCGGMMGGLAHVLLVEEKDSRGSAKRKGKQGNEVRFRFDPAAV
jgi:hypothetical protein